RRDALLAFVLRQEGARSSDELFGQLLVDVETQSCMTTSRIRLAMSSVQLFVDRIALGMEGELALDLELKEQWTRRRRYRLWEAQMKAFVFPENYLRPDLRDDKSFFFQEFEDEVSTSGLDAAKIEQAVGSYVHRLRSVAAPDVRAVGEQSVCTDPRDPKTPRRRAVHVVARTASNPHEYFHRIRYQNNEASAEDEGWWTPWAPLPNGLAGDNFVLVDRKSRGIRLVWAECSDPTSEAYSESGWLYNGNTTVSGTMWITHLKLHWLDYRRGAWASPKSADAKVDVVLGNCLVSSRPVIAGLGTMLTRFGPTSLLHLSATSDVNGDVNVACYVPVVFATSPGWALAGSGPLDLAPPERRARFSNRFLIPSYSEEVERSLEVPFEGMDTAGLRNSYPLFETPGDINTFRLAFNRVVYAGNAWGLQFGTSDFDVIGSYAGTIVDPSDVVLSRRDQAVFLRKMDGDGVLRQWWAQAFHHAGAETFREAFTDGGVERLYFTPHGAFAVQNSSSWSADFIGVNGSEAFDAVLQGDVEGTSVRNVKVDYEFDSANGPYNWELFYHIPMLVADRLRTEQQFDLARQWLEAIFDPFQSRTEFPETLLTDDGVGPDRAWRFRRFAKDGQDGMLRGQSTLLDSTEIRRLEWDPFSPHRVARTARPDAFARATVLRYIELFVEWGDSLFREDTLETINEATQRYLVARMLLGERPRQLPGTVWRAEEDGTPIVPEPPQTLLSEQLGLLPMLAEELKADGEGGFYYPHLTAESKRDSKEEPKDKKLVELPSLPSSFCVPPNPRLIALWDIIEDRLFKIRSCRNIDGARRDLPLFEPELLDEWERRAAALGTTVTEAMGEVEDFPTQRFMPSVQRALEFAQEVRGLSSQLLQAFEKRDGEQLAQVRATHERAMASAVLAVRKEQRAEAVRQLDGLRQSRVAVEERHSFYTNIERVSPDEQASLDQAKAANQLTMVSHAMSAIGAEVALIPQTGVPPGFGGLHLGESMGALSSVFGALASDQSWLSSMSATNAS
ncbi:MAG: neuraminidase-like domain-containing protein, partial [Spirochaetaceae bacterium]|nr:neuraminidase-like domain-containing protein [Spirochaetaceae bacterium]